MKITFFWIDDDGGREPSCRSDILSREGVDMLACLLTDSGGQRQKSTLNWIDEGISRVDLVCGEEVDISEWSRDSWGVELKKGVAKIYSLYDETCFSIMPIEEFKKALLSWREFVYKG
ncbi:MULTISPECIES: hypothetical protein [unclassified Pseudomonas]|uniref:hypothetical protein n=1 Tax=unclassified Pseudomonas TaxID=196821 RepID=UPI00210E7AF3|nr:MULTISPECIES: hypothetical protein [unclassified Pseudomonas]